MKNELKESTPTLLDLQSDHTNTRKEGRGAPFEGNVEMYVKELVGELTFQQLKFPKCFKVFQNGYMIKT